MKQITPKNFDQRGNSFKNWIITARELLASAIVLRREREKVEEPKVAGVSKAPMECLTFWVELMLCAFAIECLLKALWLKKGNQIAKDGVYCKILTKENHDLVALCQKVAFPINSVEEKILTKLSELGRATGRYPISRNFTQMHDGTEQWSSVEDKIIEAFILRLEHEITGAEVKPRDESPIAK